MKQVSAGQITTIRQGVGRMTWLKIIGNYLYWLEQPSAGQATNLVRAPL